MLVVGNAALDRIFVVERLPMPGETLLAARIRASARRQGTESGGRSSACRCPSSLGRGIGSDQEADEIACHLERGAAAKRFSRGIGATDESAVLVGADGENTIVSTAAMRTLARSTVDVAIATTVPGGVLLLQGTCPPT